MLSFNAALTTYGSKPEAIRYTEPWGGPLSRKLASFVHAEQEEAGNLFFGLEMELPLKREERSYVADMKTLNRVYECVHPFALCYFAAGIETVTCPATYTAQKRILKYFWERFEATEPATFRRATPAAGTHVHVSSAAFTPEHAKRFYAFFNESSLYHLRNAVAQRRPTLYCEVNPQFRTGLGYRNKYQACFMNTEHQTHEVRIFRHPKTFLESAKCLDFVKSAYDFTVNEVEVGGLAYMDWLKLENYPHLAEFVGRKKINLHALAKN